MGGRRWGIFALVAGLALASAPMVGADTPPPPYTHTLDVYVDDGHVVSDPDGIDCPDDCELIEEHPTDDGWTEYTLMASGMDDGWEASWEGCDLVSGPNCSITLDADAEVGLFWDDVAAPQITKLSVPAKVGPTGTASAEVTDNDAVAGVQFSIGSTVVGTDTEAPYTATFDTSGMSTGRDHTIKAVAVDASGNLSAAQSATFRVDHTSRVHFFVESSIGRRGVQPITIRADSDVRSLACAIDGAAAVPCSSPWTPSLGEGDHTLTVTATDDVGNTGSDTETTTVDTTSPVLAFTGGPEDGQIGVGRDVAFSFSESEPHPQGVACKLDGAWMPCAADQTVTAPGLAEGYHELAISAVDRMGNPATISRYFIVGEPAPIRGSGEPLPRVVLKAKLLPRATRLSQFDVTQLPAGSRVRAACLGASCPVQRVSTNALGDTVSLTDFLHHSLRPGTRLRLTLRRPNSEPLSWTVTIRRMRKPLVRLVF